MAAIAALVTAALLPGFTPLAAGPDGGRVLTGVFPGGERPGYLYLPPHFDRATRYPVVYLLHGLRGSPEEYLAGTHLPGFADAAITAGRLRPFIAVMPAAGPDGAYNGEWAGPWEDALLRTVAWTDANLPTVVSPSGRILAGLSAGGFGAVDIGLRHPSVFGGVGSWDGYFTPFRDGPLAHATAAQLAAHDPMLLVREEAATLRHDGMRFYVSAGGNHGAIRTSGSLAFARELRRLRLPLEVWLLPRAERGHFWTATVPTALRFALDSFSL